MTLRAIAVVRCFCKDCGYAMSAMTIGALIDAQRTHEIYARQDLIPPIVIPPLP